MYIPFILSHGRIFRNDDIRYGRQRDRIADILFQREAEAGPLPFLAVDFDLFFQLIHDL